MVKDADFIYPFPDRRCKYAFLEHTADIMIWVFAPNLMKLFETALASIFSYMGEPLYSNYDTQRYFETEEFSNLDIHFVEFLNEALYVSSCNNKCITSVVWTGFTQRSSRGLFFLSPWAKVNKDVKAVSYHQLKVRHTGMGWEAHFIIDV